MRGRLEKTDIEVTAVGLGCWQFSAGQSTANTSKWSPNRQRIAFVTYQLIP
jgi:aryl-alcohol dehydrogenase-like predicted oxidoreductase